MNLKEFCERVFGLWSVHEKDAEEWKVYVKTCDPSIGPVSAVELEYVIEGFDWDHHRVLLYPKVDLVKKVEDKDGSKD